MVSLVVFLGRHVGESGFQEGTGCVGGRTALSCTGVFPGANPPAFRREQNRKSMHLETRKPHRPLRAGSHGKRFASPCVWEPGSLLVHMAGRSHAGKCGKKAK